MKISLSKQNWEVKGYWPFVPLKEKSMETGQTLHGVTSWIQAKVPGSVHAALFEAGLIEDPYFGLNSLKCEWIENRWWMYRTSFPAVLEEKDLRQEQVLLCFEGLDYEADVFFNDEKMGSHKGMYEPFRIDLTGKIKEQNCLLVLFRGVPKEMGQIGYTSLTSTQKSRFNYKWDFSTHLVNIGFWKDVVLHVKEQAEFQNSWLTSSLEEGKGKLRFRAGIADNRREKNQELRVRIRVAGPFCKAGKDGTFLCPDKTAHYADHVLLTKEYPVTEEDIDCELTIDPVELWYPNGSGKQPLYEVTASIMDGETLLSEKKWNQGIRSVELKHNENEHPGALPYTFCINGKKIYIKGVNMTPLDHLYGDVKEEQYEYLVTAMVLAGVNLVRVWGGGLIEKEKFYQLCDENGIMIWQEFIQSSSGIDNRPAESEEFLELLKKNAYAAVIAKRSHTALVVYSGGNELMEKENTPSGLENPNIHMLYEIVKQYDGKRVFLPTSASGPVEFVTKEKGVSHDIHGNWRYEGNPGHYELYGESDSLFHSEFGTDGTSCVKSLKKFLPQASLHPTPMSGDPNWQHHGEWWGTYFRDCDIFGKIERSEEDLQKFVQCSQYLQGEGLRYIIEADRRRAFQNSGVIVWQLNEPWPNASCTNLVDYYGETKPAYYQMKNTYEPLHVSMDYRKLCCLPGEKVAWPVFVSSAEKEEQLHGKAVICTQDGTVLAEKNFEKETLKVGAENIGILEMRVPENVKNELLFVKLTAFAKSGRNSENLYIFGTKEEHVLKSLAKCEAYVEIQKDEVQEKENGRIQRCITIKNTGKHIAVQTGISLAGDGFWLLGEENYVTLFPGEKRELNFLMVPRLPGVFEKVSLEEEKKRACCVTWLGM